MAIGGHSVDWKYTFTVLDVPREQAEESLMRTTLASLLAGQPGRPGGSK